MDVKFAFVIASGMFLFSCSSGSAPVNREATESKEPVTVAEAQNLFILHCESCHGIDGKKKASDAADLSTSKLTDAQIRQMILNGNDKGMMPYKDIITSERERKALVEFVRSLRVETNE